MTVTNYIKLEFPSCSSNESFARAAAAGFAAQLDPTLDELGDIKTSVSEAVTNCIVHAYPDSIGTISMRLRILDGEKLEIVIRDKGRGIADLQQAMLPDVYHRRRGAAAVWALPLWKALWTSSRSKALPARAQR